MNTPATRHIFIAFFVFCLSLIASAQDNTPAPAATDAPSQPQKSCPMACHMHAIDRKALPKNGFHLSFDWAEVYGDMNNHVSERAFGHTFNMNEISRDGMYITAGYQFNPHFFLGGGIGAEYQLRAYAAYNDLAINPTTHTGSLVVVPIYADARAYILKRRITPYVEMKMGYAPAIYITDGTTTTKSSFYDGISAGVRLPGCMRENVHLSVGYLFRWQSNEVTGINESTGSHQVITSPSALLENRLTIGFGFTF